MFGKPNAPILQAALPRAGGGTPLVSATGSSTDIEGARRLRWDSMLVLTGISTREDLKTAGIAATYVVEDLSALSRSSRRAAGQVMLQAPMGEERPMAKMQDMRKTIEASLGNLNTTRAQEIAKSVLDKDAAKEQMTKTAADLMEWSQRNRTRLVEVVRGEVRDQLRQMGVATEEEVNALRKRVRDWNGPHVRPVPAAAARRRREAPRRTRRRPPRKPATAKSASPKRRTRAGVTRRRLDAELVRRGLEGTPAAAREAVEAGVVQVAGVVASKPATMVADDAPIAMLGASRPFVSRGGEQARRRARAVRRRPGGAVVPGRGGVHRWVHRRACSQRGAAGVVAVDVGYGQLAWALRTDPRVTVLERTNIRDLTPGDLPSPVDLVVADLSFISLRLVLPDARAARRARGADSWSW